MTEPGAFEIEREINNLTSWLVERSLCDDQNAAFTRRGRDGRVSVLFAGAQQIGSALRSQPYSDLYSTLVASRTYNARLLDGALLQLTYEFVNESIQRHRLAFLPSPTLEEFQNNPDVYLDDEIYGDIVVPGVVTVPIRFDYDRDAAVELIHPASHLTLGQYQNCRIPVSAPLAPSLFIQFIIRSFYNSAFSHIDDDLPRIGRLFDTTLTPLEMESVHVQLPRPSS